MKKIEAIIKPFKLAEVKLALLEAGLEGMTATDVRGIGRQCRHREVYRASEYANSFIPKIKLEVLVADHVVDQVRELILEAASTGKIGDGKIFVYHMDEVLRIRTGERGPQAV